MRASGSRPDPSSRRLGQRVSFTDVQGHLLVEVRRVFRRTVRVPVQIDNASVTGMAFVADPPEEVRPGQVLRFELNGIESSVRVRRVSRTTTRAGHAYGVEFIDATPAVLPEIHRLANRTEHEAWTDPVR